MRLSCSLFCTVLWIDVAATEALDKDLGEVLELIMIAACLVPCLAGGRGLCAQSYSQRPLVYRVCLMACRHLRLSGGLTRGLPLTSP